MKEYINLHDIICNLIVKKFAKKQELEFDGWISDEVGGVALFSGSFSFNFSEIMLDIRTKQPKGLIIQWQNDCDNNQKKQYINYKSYSMGLRYDQLNKDVDHEIV